MAQQFTLVRDQLTAPKLTDWSNEPNYQDLYGDFLAAKSSHDNQVAKNNRWTELLRVEGSQKPKTIKGRSSVQPKLIRRQAEWRYSALTEPFLSSSKLFKVSPVTFEDGDAARQNELVLNYQFRVKINRVKFVDDLVRSTVDEGTCIVRVGWVRNAVKEKVEVPSFDHYEPDSEDQIQELQLAIQLEQEDPRKYEADVSPEVKAAVEYWKESNTPTVAVQNGTETVNRDKIIENRPTVQILNPKNVYIDPSCEGDIDKAMFVIVSFETSKAELLKEKSRYKNLDHVLWDSAAPVTTPEHTSGMDQTFQFKDEMRKRIVAYEYWGFYDITGKGEELTPIVATWVGQTLIRMERNPFPDQKLPFVVIPYLPNKRELYGEPDAELLEDNQKVLGAVTRGMIDLLGRSANSQQGFAKGMLDVLNRRRFENGQDYEYNPGMNPNNALIEHKYPEIPVSAMNMLAMQNQEAEALTGVKSFGGGISGEAYGDVAAGIRGVLDAASKREMAILRRIAKGMNDIGRKFIAMNGAFLSDKETIRITNEEFVSVSRDDLIGDFDLEVDISTAEVDNAKAQDLGFMLQTIGPNMDLGMTTLILSQIAELKRMPELAHKIKTYKPEPDPMVQQLKQLELQEKQLTLDKLQSEIELNKAKAQKESAIADTENLNFVEQETGTKHARDLEKQAGQARGNQDLEVTKSLLKARKQANGAETKPNIDAAIGYNALSKAENSPTAVNANPQLNL